MGSRLDPAPRAGHRTGRLLRRSACQAGDRTGDADAVDRYLPDQHRRGQPVRDAKLTPPAEKLDAKHQALLDDLKKKDGPTFDAAYIKAQYDGHVATVAMFEAYAKGGDNARMKQFANDLLPTLKTHLDHVSKLR
jgi:predicted outer membrane protein